MTPEEIAAAGLAAANARLIVIESPYAGDLKKHLAYARRCMADSLRRGEVPSASHLLYTQPGILDDAKPEERLRGIHAGYAWLLAAELQVFYTDLGWSSGMKAAKIFGAKVGIYQEERTIGAP